METRNTGRSELLHLVVILIFAVTIGYMILISVNDTYQFRLKAIRIADAFDEVPSIIAVPHWILLGSSGEGRDFYAFETPKGYKPWAQIQFSSNEFETTLYPTIKTLQGLGNSGAKVKFELKYEAGQVVKDYLLDKQKSLDRGDLLKAKLVK